MHVRIDAKGRNCITGLNVLIVVKSITFFISLSFHYKYYSEEYNVKITISMFFVILATNVYL